MPLRHSKDDDDDDDYMFVQILFKKAFLTGLFSGRLHVHVFSKGLVIGGNFPFQNGLIKRDLLKQRHAKDKGLAKDMQRTSFH